MSNRSDTARPWVTTAVLSLCGTVSSLQFTLVIPLLPELPDLLAVSDESASWLITATLLSAAVSAPIVSRAADMYGKRRMLLLALSALTAGSLICALTSSFAVMLAGRALQGLASSLIAVGISLLRDQLPPHRVSSAIALMSATLGVGAALGLPLAGIVTKFFGWHAIFWLTATVSALLIVGLLLAVRESSVRTLGRFDMVGALMLSAALVALLLPVTKGALWGWSSPKVLTLATLGLLVTAAWVPFELRVNHPMVDLRTAVRRPVLLTNAASLFVGFAMFVNMLVTTRLLQLPAETGSGLGLSVLATGLAMVPSGLAMVVISPASGALLDRWGGRSTLLLGTGVMSISYVGRVFFSGSLFEIVLGSTLVSVGTALAFASMPALIMASVPITETASANGINSLVRSLGTAIASAVVIMVLAGTASTVPIGHIASAEGHRLVLVLAVAATIIGMIFVWFIPTPTAAGAAPKRAEIYGDETVVSGRIVSLDGAGIKNPAIVIVFDLAGTPIDWARSDHLGHYSVALPGPGSYVFVTNAQGWAPSALVIDFTNDASDQLLELSDKLTVSGMVTRHGLASSGAVVTINAIEGEHMATTRGDHLGRYCFPLPPTGRYLLAAIDPITHSATAYKTLLTLESRVIDLELHR